MSSSSSSCLPTIAVAFVHFNVTEHPTAAWTAQQIVDTFPDDSAPAYLLRDRDRIYGHAFRQRVKGMGIGEVLTAPSQPVAEPLRGTAHRLDPARVSGSWCATNAKPRREAMLRKR